MNVNVHHPHKLTVGCFEDIASLRVYDQPEDEARGDRIEFYISTLAEADTFVEAAQKLRETMGEIIAHRLRLAAERADELCPQSFTSGKRCRLIEMAVDAARTDDDVDDAIAEGIRILSCPTAVPVCAGQAPGAAR